VLVGVHLFFARLYMTYDRRAKPEAHGHLKESLKKQGKSDELAEQIAVQTVAETADRKRADKASAAPAKGGTREKDTPKSG